MTTLLALTAGLAGAANDDGVTVISSTPPSTVRKTAGTDTTTVVHKSSHKKKSGSASASNGGATSSGTTTQAGALVNVITPIPTTPSNTHANSSVMATTPTTMSRTTVSIIKVPSTISPATVSISTPPPARSVPMPTSGISSPFYSPAVPPVGALATGQAPMSSPDMTPTPTSPIPGVSPQIETGLPVARQGAFAGGGSPYVSLPMTKAAANSHPFYGSTLLPATSTAAGSFSVPTRGSAASGEYSFVSSRRFRNTYPWKSAIVTTMFWIGEGSTPISHTDNVQSSWDEDWLQNNHGSDNPYNRSSYASGSHASTLNPFYCALPFNDLAFPDKARRWLPAGWYRKPKDGRQVSACKDRWLEIKNAKGDICYAQWEDVGPLRYDHAEYVFGDERPIGLGDDHAGLDVSPAVAAYLNISDRNRFTSWRFVDEEDVRPGAWLKYDEQAVLFMAFKQIKEATPRTVPIQRTEMPIDDQSVPNANKKKFDQSKG